MTGLKKFRAPKKVTTPKAKTVPITVPVKAAPVQDIPKAKDPQQEAADAQNLIGYKMLQHSYKDSSVALSPLSISMCLALALGGMDAVVAADMADKLGGARFYPTLARLLASRHSTLRGGSALAIKAPQDGDWTLAPTFVAWASKLDAEIKVAPSLPAVAGPLNSWIADKTDGCITNLIDAALLSGADAVLVNALTFTGTWRSKFGHTEPGIFHGAQGDRTVQMMHRKDRMSIEKARGYTAVHMGFSPPEAESEDDESEDNSDSDDSGLTDGSHFIAYLPDKRGGPTIPELLETLADPHRPKTKSSKPKVNLQFPRLTEGIEFTSNMMALLAELGLPVGQPLGRAFNSGSGPGPIISAMVHATKIEWDELGARAQAATVFGVCKSACPRPEVPIEIHFDRPFVFVIEQGEGIPAFMGVFV